MVDKSKNIFIKVAFGFFFIVLAIILIISYSHKGKRMQFKRTKSYFSVPTQDVRKVTLKNGMTVILFQNKSIPKVLVQIAYNIGSYVEREGERGLAHLIEHMIFKGTQKLSETDIDEIARRYGASYNAFTSMDVTSYYFETNKNNWQPFMSILADCMQNARFDAQHLASELKAVIQELKMYKDDYWLMMLEKVDSLLYPANHPYHYPIIGYKEDLLNLTVEKLKRFYKKFYRPDHATLFVVGDIDFDEVLAQVHEHFENITFEGESFTPEFPLLQDELVTQHTKFFEDIKTEQLGFYWRIPGLKDKHDILSAAAAALLGDGEGSRLHRALVDEKKVASSVAVYDQKFMESGVFLILIEPMAGKRALCKEVIQQELEKAVKDGFTEKELEHMTKSQAKHFFMRLQNFKNFTYEWINSYFASNDQLAIFKVVNEFAALESAQIQKFIEDRLDPLLINQIEVLPMPETKRKVSEQVKHFSDELDKKILSRYVRTAPVEEPRYAYELAGPKPLNFSFPKTDREVVLKNGLKVLLKAQHALPLMSVNCKFKEYFYFSSTREGVLVDLMMNMLIEGSTGYSKEEMVDFFEFYGADYFFGATGAGLSMLSADYQQILERFLHVLTQPTFPASAFDKVKDIAVDSFMRSKDDPVEVGMNQLKHCLYQKHPFGFSFDEAINAIKKTTIADLKSFHQAYVTPANMVLVLVGDFDLDAMERSITDLFEKWTGGPEKKMSYPASDFIPHQKIDVSMVRDQVVLLMGKPSPITIYHEDLVPLKLLNYIGFYSLGSRLFKLREQSGLFYTAFGAWAGNASKEHGFDYVGAILSLDKIEQAEQQMLELINDMANNGVTEAELAAAQQLYLKSLIDAVSTHSSQADLFAFLQAFNLPADYYDAVLKRVQSMSLAELNQVCKRYFTTQGMARIRVGRFKKEKESYSSKSSI